MTGEENTGRSSVFVSTMANDRQCIWRDRRPSSIDTAGSDALKLKFVLTSASFSAILAAEREDNPLAMRRTDSLGTLS